MAVKNPLQLSTSYQNILSIALPIMGGNFFHSVISLTDITFMGRVGEDDLAACGIAGMFYVVISMIGFSIALGTQILIARRAGQNDRLAISFILENVLYLLLAIAIVLMAFILFASPPLLHFLFDSDAVYRKSVEYLNFRAFGIPAIFLLFGIGSLYTGIGRTMAILYSTLIMTGLNIFLDYVLVFGAFGFPEMGIRGAGLASMIAENVAFLVILLHLFRKGYVRKFLLFRFNQPSWSHIRSILNLSAAIVLQSITGSIGWFVFFVWIENYIGKHELAASNIIRILYTFFAIPARGLSGATNTLVSNMMGQRSHGQVMESIWKVVILSVAITAVTALPLLVWPEFFLRLFTDDWKLIDTAARVVPVIVLALFIVAIGNVFFRGVTGVGAVRFALYMELFTIASYLLYAWVMVAVLGSNLSWSWTTEIAYWLIVSAISFWYMMSKRWHRLEI